MVLLFIYRKSFDSSLKIHIRLYRLRNLGSPVSLIWEVVLTGLSSFYTDSRMVRDYTWTNIHVCVHTNIHVYIRIYIHVSTCVDTYVGI